MMNALGQPIGAPLIGWHPPIAPTDQFHDGEFCRLERLNPDRHAAALYRANAMDTDGAMWTYLPYGPFADFAAYRTWVESRATIEDPMFYAIIERRSNQAAGVAAYQRIDPANGVIEIAHLAFSPLLQGTVASTEAMYLMMAYAVGLGYRRCEWKCDSLNAPSRRAAQRLGFSFEGVFRQAVVVKGRNRDTAWYATIDLEWPALRAAFEAWLAKTNFDANGRQRTRLSAATAPILVQRG